MALLHLVSRFCIACIAELPHACERAVRGVSVHTHMQHRPLFARTHMQQHAASLPSIVCAHAHAAFLPCVVCGHAHAASLPSLVLAAKSLSENSKASEQTSMRLNAAGFRIQDARVHVSDKYR